MFINVSFCFQGVLLMLRWSVLHCDCTHGVACACDVLEISLPHSLCDICVAWWRPSLLLFPPSLAACLWAFSLHMHTHSHENLVFSFLSLWPRVSTSFHKLPVLCLCVRPASWNEREFLGRSGLTCVALRCSL